MSTSLSSRSDVCFPGILLSLLVLALLAAPAYAQSRDAAGEAACHDVTDIEGTYDCSGECAVTAADGTRSVSPVQGEVDEIKRFPGATTGLYQVDITGAGGFHEVEIGALSERTLRTATVQVSDQTYPVLEEYVFDTDASCRSVGYTKIVRNPVPYQFKACNIQCTKQ